MIKQLYREGNLAFLPDVKYDDETKTLYIGKDVTEYVYVHARNTKYIWCLYDSENSILSYLIDENGDYINNLDVKNVIVDKDNETMQIIDGCLTKKPNRTLWVPERHDFPKDEKFTLTFLEGEPLVQKNYNTLTMKYDDTSLLTSGKMGYYALENLEEANYIKRIIFPIKSLNEMKIAERIKEYGIKTKTNEPEIAILVGNADENGKITEIK